jgi:hypothetical protein
LENKKRGDRTMKKILAFALLAVSSSAWSSTVLIDFESVLPGDVTGPDIEGDYYFETDGFGFYSQSGIGGGGTGNQYAVGFKFDGLYSPPAHVLFGQIGGGAFALHDLDMDCFGVSCQIWGQKAGGGTITTFDVADLGSGDWLNVTWVGVESPQFATGAPIHVDNIVVGSAVPVPAAVWLFGSGLGLLGFVRRKKVVAA